MTYTVTTTASENSRPIVTTSSGTTYYIDSDCLATNLTSSTNLSISAGTWTVNPAVYTYTTNTVPNSGIYINPNQNLSGIPATTVDDLEKKFKEMEEWYAGKLCEMIGAIEERGYEIDELKGKIADLEETLRQVVDILVKANEPKQ
jgi:hypothetical protein